MTIARIQPQKDYKCLTMHSIMCYLPPTETKEDENGFGQLKAAFLAIFKRHKSYVRLFGHLSNLIVRQRASGPDLLDV